MSASLAHQLPRRRRALTLTPLIDVVFILLVFFMLAARPNDWQALSVVPATPATAVSVDRDWVTIKLGKAAIDMEAIAAQRQTAQRQSAYAAPVGIQLQPQSGVSVQRLVDTLAALEQAALTPVRVEAASTPSQQP